jgi:hypothetical protein
MIRNSDPLSDTLKDLKQSIRSGLVVSLIQAEWQIIKTRTLLAKKRQLLNSTNAMTSHAYEQFCSISKLVNLFFFLQRQTTGPTLNSLPFARCKAT